MGIKKFTFKVGRDCVRKLYVNGHAIYELYMAFSDIPLDLPTDINPRKGGHKSSAVYRTLVEATETNDNFPLCNNGILILAPEEPTYDKAKEEYYLSLPVDVPNQRYGIADGGHTYEAISEYMEGKTGRDSSAGSDFKKAVDRLVRVQLICGIRDEEKAVEIAIARNTNNAVESFSRANLEKKFDWIKKCVGGEIASRIQWHETSAKDKPFTVKDIIALMECFDPSYYNRESLACNGHPMKAYTSKTQAFEKANEIAESLPGINQEYQDILKDIIEFRDHILKDSPERWGPNIGSVKLFKSGDLYADKAFIGSKDKWEHQFASAALLPILAAFRVFVVEKKDGKYKWDDKALTGKSGLDMLKHVWQQVGQQMLKELNTMIRQRDGKLSGLGKSTETWECMYSICKGYVKEQQLSYYRNAALQQS